MLDRTCVACARPIDLSRRADAKFCGPACYTWSRRHPGEIRPLGPQLYACKQCRETFSRDGLVRGNQPQFCGDRCWDAWRHRQRPFGEWRKAEPFKTRSFTCADCGSVTQDSGHGPSPTRCGGCAAVQKRQWQRDNPERAAVRKLRWARANPEAARLSYRRHRERRLLGVREYQAKNRDRVLAWRRDRQNRRRARQAAVTVEAFTSEEIYARDGWVCGICETDVDPDRRRPNPMSPSLDHIIPLSRGGAHARWNVQLAHLSCNIRKGASLP